MKPYLITVPPILRPFFGNVMWRVKTVEKVVYLTFDDGPHPTETKFVLDVLKRQDAKATFFCIGDNVRKFPEVYESILGAGHATGNHTFHHMDCWQVKAVDYLADVDRAAVHINSKLFRPPYGKISAKRVKQLNRKGYTTVMWTAISADFDANQSPEECVSHVMKYLKPGAIFVFHDSEKASRNLRAALPEVLRRISEAGYRCEALPPG